MIKIINTKTLTASLAALLVLGVTACSGGGKKESSETVHVDMTRPPVTITGAEQATESDPDETVSFEKWKDEREEKRAANKPK